jgi:hypothetical protein
MRTTPRARRATMALAALVVAPLTAFSGCEAAEFSVDDAKARWQGREATLYTYDNNTGQTTTAITGEAVYPFHNTKYDTSADDGATEKGAVVSVSIGKDVVDLVGSSALICDAGVTMLPRADIDLAATSTDSAVPWLNVLQRNVEDAFAGRSRLVVIKTQNDVPVAAFTADSVSDISGNDEIKNTTWFKVQDGGKSAYCWAYRVNYISMPTTLIDPAAAPAD